MNNLLNNLIHRFEIEGGLLGEDNGLITCTNSLPSLNPTKTTVQALSFTRHF